eukprot:g27950.t1
MESLTEGLSCCAPDPGHCYSWLSGAVVQWFVAIPLHIFIIREAAGMSIMQLPFAVELGWVVVPYMFSFCSCFLPISIPLPPSFPLLHLTPFVQMERVILTIFWGSTACIAISGNLWFVSLDVGGECPDQGGENGFEVEGDTFSGAGACGDSGSAGLVGLVDLGEQVVLGSVGLGSVRLEADLMACGMGTSRG